MADGGSLLTATFNNVSAYELSGDSFGNIIDELLEVPAFELYSSNAAALIVSYKASGAHGSWVLSASAAREHIESHHLVGFTLSSIIGLSGWVIAQGYSCVPST